MNGPVARIRFITVAEAANGVIGESFGLCPSVFRLLLEVSNKLSLMSPLEVAIINYNNLIKLRQNIQYIYFQSSLLFVALSGPSPFYF